MGSRSPNYRRVDDVYLFIVRDALHKSRILRTNHWMPEVLQMTSQERKAALDEDRADVLTAVMQIISDAKPTEYKDHVHIDTYVQTYVLDVIVSALSSPAVTNGGLQDFACKVSDMLWGGELGWTRTGLDGMFNELKKRMSSPAVPVIEGLDEAIEEVAAFFERDDGPVDECATTLLKAARAYAALPKMQKVDFDVVFEDRIDTYSRKIKNENPSLERADEMRFAIEALEIVQKQIKAKYGELYAEVKE